jgi:hypothetical protein
LWGLDFADEAAGLTMIVNAIVHHHWIRDPDTPVHALVIASAFDVLHALLMNVRCSTPHDACDIMLATWDYSRTACRQSDEDDQLPIETISWIISNVVRGMRQCHMGDTVPDLFADEIESRNWFAEFDVFDEAIEPRVDVDPRAIVPPLMHLQSTKGVQRPPNGLPSWDPARIVSREEITRSMRRRGVVCDPNVVHLVMNVALATPKERSAPQMMIALVYQLFATTSDPLSLEHVTPQDMAVSW